MTLTNALLAANWLEQKHQGQKLRESLARNNPPIPVDRIAIDTHLNKVRSDPKTFSAWMARRSLFSLIRIGLFGLTNAEKAEAHQAWDHEAGLSFPKNA